MKRLTTLILAILFGCLVIGLVLCVSGCGAIEIYTPDGKLVAREVSLLKGVQFQRFTTTAPTGQTAIEGGSGLVDDAAIKAITDGVVAGVIHGMTKP